MTNKEKAKQIALMIMPNFLAKDDDDYDVIQQDCYLAALDMAEWKDEQFASIIEDKLNYARKMIKENKGKSVCTKYAGMRKILIEIKNELNSCE